MPQARHVREVFAPDWLLVQIFDNDPADNVHYAEEFELGPGEPFEALPAALEPPTDPLRQLAHAFDSSVLRRRLRQLGRRIRGKRLHSTPYVRPDARPEHAVIDRAAAIARHAVDLSAARPLQPDFGFHDPAQGGAWRERLDWNARLVAQLLDEARADGVRVALLYVPAPDVFLRPPAPNPLAEGLRALAAERGAVWLDAGEAFSARARPEELYYAYDGHLNPAGHAAVAELLSRELAPRLRQRVRVRRVALRTVGGVGARARGRATL